MAVKILVQFRGLAIIGVALLGFAVIANWAARAEPSNPHTVIVAQNEIQTTTAEKNAPSPVSKEPESKTAEKKEPTGVEKKPLKDFQPSEKIEAEQSVDFPYDI